MDDLRRLVDRVTPGRRATERPLTEPGGEGAPAAVVASEPTGAAPAPDHRRGPFLGLVVAAIVVLWIARDVLGPFVVAAVTAYAFSPLVTKAERRTGWPRPVVVGIGYG